MKRKILLLSPEPGARHWLKVDILSELNGSILTVAHTPSLVIYIWTPRCLDLGTKRWNLTYQWKALKQALYLVTLSIHIHFFLKRKTGFDRFAQVQR